MEAKRVGGVDGLILVACIDGACLISSSSMCSRQTYNSHGKFRVPQPASWGRFWLPRSTAPLHKQMNAGE